MFLLQPHLVSSNKFFMTKETYHESDADVMMNSVGELAVDKLFGC